MLFECLLFGARIKRGDAGLHGGAVVFALGDLRVFLAPCGGWALVVLLFDEPFLGDAR